MAIDAAGSFGLQLLAAFQGKVGDLLGELLETVFVKPQRHVNNCALIEAVEGARGESFASEAERFFYCRDADIVLCARREL